MVSSVFFYVANGVNLFTSYLTTIMSSSKSLGTMSLIVWVCITVVYLFFSKKSVRKDSEHQFASSEMQELSNLPSSTEE